MFNDDHPVFPVLQDIGKEITQKVKPKAVVVFSAHWQAKPDLIQVNNAVENDLIYEFVAPFSDRCIVPRDRSDPYDSFYGFPDYMYKVQYPNKGDPGLASRIISLLSTAGIKAEGVKRGLDHGVWAGFHVGA